MERVGRSERGEPVKAERQATKQPKKDDNTQESAR